MVKVESNNFDKFEQDLGVRKVKIDLIMTKGAPNILTPLRGQYWQDQLTGPRTHDPRCIKMRIRSKKVSGARTNALFEIFKPRRSNRAMIQDQVGH